MAKIEKTVQVSKELNDVGKAVAAVVRKAVEVTRDGYQASDLMPIMATVVSELVTAVDGAQQIPDEVKEDLNASIYAVEIPIREVVQEWLQPVEPSPGTQRPTGLNR
jgi:urease gamma subunit